MKKFVLIFALFLSQVCGSEAQIETLSNEYQHSRNIWLLSLQSYRNYMQTSQRAQDLQNQIQKNSTDIAAASEEIGILRSNLKLFNYENRQPFYELFEPLEGIIRELENSSISHFSLISGDIAFSVKQSNKIIDDYISEYKKAQDLIAQTRDKASLLEARSAAQKRAKDEFIARLQNDKKLLNIAFDTLLKTQERVNKQYDLYNKRLTFFKAEELRKFGAILLTVVILFVLLSLAKLALKVRRKTSALEEDDQRYFMIRKILNILFVIVVVLIFAFSYVDNIAQVLAVFGVIGAGLTVVMKEWVLSYVGWFVLITSNSIQIGDRIKISKDGRSIIGDVINISLTKLTLYENITNDALTEHKKAGRVIFVPNYYLIMGEVYNYTHLSLKTILDLIEIRLSFDSNIKKAERIGFESAELVTSRFTEMAKRQYDALKSRYTLRNMTQYPKVFFYPSAHGNGIVMGVWYVSPYREILKHKSEVTKEILERISKESDITLLYSGQSLYFETQSDR